MMKIGSKEWFKQLNEMTKFPSYFAFYLLQKGDTKSIAVKIVESKAKDADNIKYGGLTPTLALLLTGSNIAIIDVSNVSDANEYYQKLKTLTDKWNIGIIDEKDMAFL